MASRSKITEAGDDVADAVSSAGRRAGSRARKAGADAAAAIDGAATASASRMRRASRAGARAYDDAVEEVDGRVATLEETIRQNPLAAAGAALVIGLFLGRFVL